MRPYEEPNMAWEIILMLPPQKKRAPALSYKIHRKRQRRSAASGESNKTFALVGIL
jgi:hypothetical protein